MLGHLGQFPLLKHPQLLRWRRQRRRPYTGVTAIPHALVLNKPQSNKPAEEECRWGLHCPICMKSTPTQKAQNTEDWNGERQDNQQRNYYPRSARYSSAYDIPDRFSQQLKLEREWNESVEQLNDEYSLDCYSSSESDSEFELEHKYETHIKNHSISFSH